MPNKKHLSLNFYFAIVTIIKIFATWFSLNIMTKLTPIYDPFAYTAGTLTGAESFNRTNFVALIAQNIAKISYPETPHYVFSVLTGFFLCCFLAQLRPRFWPYFIILGLLPSVTIWCSLVTKESLAVDALLLCLTAWVRILSGRHGVSTFLIALTGLIFYSFLRPHFGLCMSLLLFGTTLLLPSHANPNHRTIISRQFSRLNNFTIALVLIISIATCSPLILAGVTKIFYLSQGYFSYEMGRSGRGTWLIWKEITDYYDNVLWGIPFGVIGPLPSEATTNILFLAAFVEGILVLLTPILPLLIFSRPTMKNPSQTQIYFSRVLYFVVFPVTFLILLVHSPMGMPNPGSAVRYRAGVEYLLTFPALILALFHLNSEPYHQEVGCVIQ